MGKNMYLRVMFILFSLVISISMRGRAYKLMRVGNYQTKVCDYAGMGDREGWLSMGYYPYDEFSQAQYFHRGYQMGCKDWIDENGNTIPYKISGSGCAGGNEIEVTMPVPDTMGITIFRYYRSYPEVEVDGFPLNPPLSSGDKVDPDRIPGTADVMIESTFRTSMGLTVHQRVLGWSQVHHDDYIIYDWTLTNTGNIDLDDEIELPNNTIGGFYFLRQLNFCPGGTGRWAYWHSAYGEFPGDSLRMVYSYSAWTPGATYDDFGSPRRSTGFWRDPPWLGEAILHADSSTDNSSDDPSQPQMTGVETVEKMWVKLDETRLSPTDKSRLYTLMEEGWYPLDGQPYMEGTYPGTHHTPRMDEQGYAYPVEFPWWLWEAASYYSIGPYDIPPGDSIRIVFAPGIGSISTKTGWQKGIEWLAGELTWDGPYNLSPPAELVYNVLGDIVDSNDIAKDHWLHTGRDSLYRNMWYAQWNVEHNYNVPIPPPAPSVTVNSRPDEIAVEWGDEAEGWNTLAGYRIYRARGARFYSLADGVEVGDWKLVAEVGPGTLTFEDTEVQRGVDYYYYVSAYGEGYVPGVGTAAGVNDTVEVLESGKYRNMTTRSANLSRPPGEELSEIRVVPNPYNASAIEVQFPGELRKIVFMELPPECTIKIFNESCDLIKTIEHTDGSGDEVWADPTRQNYMVTSSGQVPVSGLYIAHIETPDGKSTNVHFCIVR